LGGYSKGVDRSNLIKCLKGKVKYIACFGAEANNLHIHCINNGIPASAHTTLDNAFIQALDQSATGDIVLLSPAGSSYDLFVNYQERGEYFKHLVARM
jgi:UDP-N-acetylmuramoylalanine--D-glutamate ligase